MKFVPLLLSLAVCACGGARKETPPPAVPAATPTDACPAVQAILAEHGRHVTAAREDTASRQGVAAALLAMRGTEDTSLRAAAELDALRLPDGDLAKSVRAYAAAARKSASWFGGASKSLEGSAGDLSAAGRALDEAMADLARSCEPPGGARKPKLPAECTSVKQKLAQLREAETSQTDQLEQIAGTFEHLQTPALDAKASKVVQSARTFAAKAKAAVARLDAGKTDELSAELLRAADGVKAACGAWPEVPSVSPLYASEWSVAPKADVRKLTVVVRVRPPPALEATFASFASAGDELSPLYRAVAHGGFGSGLVLVKNEGTQKRIFVVTNRHVVDLVEEAEIYLDGGSSLGKAPVVYVDPWYDLAVLALPPDAPFTHGFAFAAAPAKDQLPVIATGFPGIGALPSYQTARGYVSNERFVFQDEGRTLLYVQHTAPIDGGSSGGPLTNEAGALLGVNTMKLRGRENVALAAPGFAVAEVAHHATELERLAHDADFKQRRARDACLALVGELGSTKARLRVAEQMVATSLVARVGLESWKQLSAADAELTELWKRDPIEAMRVSTVLRLWQGAHNAGAVDGAEACARVDQSQWASLGGGDRVTFAIRVGEGLHPVVFRWERGTWRVADSDLLDVAPPAPAKPAKPTKRAKPKRPKA